MKYVDELDRVYTKNGNDYTYSFKGVLDGVWVEENISYNKEMADALLIPIVEPDEETAYDYTAPGAPSDGTPDVLALMDEAAARVRSAIGTINILNYNNLRKIAYLEEIGNAVTKSINRLLI